MKNTFKIMKTNKLITLIIGLLMVLVVLFFMGGCSKDKVSPMPPPNVIPTEYSLISNWITYSTADCYKLKYVSFLANGTFSTEDYFLTAQGVCTAKDFLTGTYDYSKSLKEIKLYDEFHVYIKTYKEVSILELSLSFKDVSTKTYKRN